MDSGQWAVGSGQWAVGSGQWAVGSGQWAVGSGQWAVGSGSRGQGQWAVGSGQWTGDRGPGVRNTAGAWEVLAFPGLKASSPPGTGDTRRTWFTTTSLLRGPEAHATAGRETGATFRAYDLRCEDLAANGVNVNGWMPELLRLW